MVAYILAREEHKLTIRKAEQASPHTRARQAGPTRSLLNGLISRFAR